MQGRRGETLSGTRGKFPVLERGSEALECAAQEGGGGNQPGCV